MMKKLSLTLILSIFISSFVFGHSSKSKLYLNAPRMSYDEDIYNDIGMTLFLKSMLSIDLEYRNNLSRGGESSLALFAGIGAGEVLQLQVGTSFEKALWRFCIGVPIVLREGTPKRPEYYIILRAHFEFGKDHALIGLGVSWPLHIF